MNTCHNTLSSVSQQACQSGCIFHMSSGLYVHIKQMEFKQGMYIIVYCCLKIFVILYDCCGNGKWIDWFLVYSFSGIASVPLWTSTIFHSIFNFLLTKIGRISLTFLVGTTVYHIKYPIFKTLPTNISIIASHGIHKLFVDCWSMLNATKVTDQLLLEFKGRSTFHQHVIHTNIALCGT